MWKIGSLGHVTKGKSVQIFASAEWRTKAGNTFHLPFRWVVCLDFKLSLERNRWKWIWISKILGFIPRNEQILPLFLFSQRAFTSTWRSIFTYQIFSDSSEEEGDRVAVPGRASGAGYLTIYSSRQGQIESTKKILSLGRVGCKKQ